MAHCPGPGSMKTTHCLGSPPKIADISGGIVRSHRHDDAGTRSYPAWFADAATNGASSCDGARSGLAAGESIFTRLRARIVVARRRRRRGGFPPGVVVLEKNWNALNDCPVRFS